MKSLFVIMNIEGYRNIEQLAFIMKGTESFMRRISKSVFTTFLLVTIMLSGCADGVGNTEVQSFSKEDPEAYYKENAYIRKQLNVEKADVTQDGIDDYIVTAMYFSPGTKVTNKNLDETIQEQLGYEDVFVEVYDGSKVKNLKKLETPIFVSGFSAVHAGNGQMNLVYRDGNVYLLESNLWEGQGFLGYSYEVYSLDGEGNKNVVDNYDINFVMEAGLPERALPKEQQREQLLEFKNKITSWFDDALLLAATDVSFDKQLITMGEERYVPEDFYDQKWEGAGIQGKN